MAVVLALVIVISGIGGYLLHTETASGSLVDTATAYSTTTETDSHSITTVVIASPGSETTQTVTSTSTSEVTGQAQTVTTTATTTLTSVSTSTSTRTVTSTETTTSSTASNTSLSTSTTESGISGHWVGVNSTQVTTTSVAAGPGGYIEIGVSAGKIVSASSVATPSGLPSGSESPFGWWEFEIADLTPGQTAVVTLTFPSAIPSNALLYKSDCGSTPGVYQAESLVDSVGGNVMRMSLTDQGAGDCDGVPGQITDPAGLVVLDGGPNSPARGVPQFPFGTVALVAIALPLLMLLRRPLGASRERASGA